MNIFDYVKSLLPTIGKSRLEENITMVSREISTISGPCYGLALKSLGRLNSPEGKALEKTWGSLSRDLNKGLIKGVSEGLENLQESMDIVQSFVDTNFENVMSSDAISALNTNLIQFISAADYLSLFSIKLLNYLYTVETNFQTGEATVETSLTKSEVDHIVGGMIIFTTAMNSVAKKPEKIKRMLEAVPDVLINAGTQAMAESSLSRAAIDPLNMFSQLGFKGSPIYMVRMVIAEHQVRRYNASRDLKQVLELRKLNLEQQQAKTPSPQIEREIAVLQSRIDGETAKIKEMEDSIK